MKCSDSILEKAEKIFLFLLFILFFSCFSFLLIKQTLTDFNTIKNQEVTIAIVQNVTFKEKRNYKVEITYEENGIQNSGYFYVKKQFSDSVGNYFETKYRKGNKIPVLLGKQIIPYSQRNKILFTDILFSAIYIFVVILCAAALRITFFAKIKNQKKYSCTPSQTIHKCINIFCYLCFICGLILLMTSKSTDFLLLFFSSGFIIMVLSEIIFEQKLNFRTISLEFKEHPILFILLASFELILGFVLIGVSINQIFMDIF